VLLGGLLGVALTLGAAVIWSGTFDYAPRQEVDALNRNLNTMQANQELAWQRVDQLTVSAEEMARKIRQIESFTGRIGAMEEDLASATSELADAKTTLGDLSTNLGELEASLETNMNSLDERVTLTEDQMGAVSTQVNQLEKSFGAVESRMQNIDGFFGSLRDLLVELEGPGTMLAPESDSASE
jgi:chromosome segregation ATPase